MTTRERALTVGLGGFLGVATLGFVAYQLILTPLNEKRSQALNLQKEIDTKSEQVFAIEAENQRLKQVTMQSLPADVKVARGQYSNFIEALLRRAEFPPGSYSLTSSDPDNKSAPVIAPKKPAYTKLGYELTVKGDLYTLVDFMQHFYEQPLLHTIRKISVQRPSDAKSRAKSELDIRITLEALVLDGAENRVTLLPNYPNSILAMSGLAAPMGLNVSNVATGRGSALRPTNVIAQPPRDYLAIAGKNIFYGPPAEVKSDIAAKPPEEDVSAYVTLTSVTGYEDGVVIAAFRDKSTNNDYTLTQSPDGKVVVDSTYDLNGKKKPLRKPGLDIIYGTEEGRNLRTWRVRKVGLSEVILEKVGESAKEETSEKPKPSGIAMLGGGMGAFVDLPEGKIFRVSIGQSLDSPSLLLSREARQAIYPALRRPVSTVAIPATDREGEGR